MIDSGNKSSVVGKSSAVGLSFLVGKSSMVDKISTDGKSSTVRILSLIGTGQATSFIDSGAKQVMSHI